MTQIANYATPGELLYYRHSGRFSPSGLAMTLVLGSLAAILIGFVYAYIDLYNPIASWITFLITGGTGFALGLVLSKLIKAGRIRNVKLALAIGVFCTGLMFLTAWEVWLYAFLRRADVDVTLWDIISSPAATWNVLLAINENGAWSLKGSSPVTGIFLWLLWAVEAAILIWIPLKLTKTAVTELPFCERCNKWCTARELIRFNTGDVPKIRSQLEAKDFNSLAALGKAKDAFGSSWRAYFQGCADCDTTQTLCIDQMVITRNKEGKAQVKLTPVVKRLMLSPEDTVAVATMVAMLEAPPPPVEEAPQAQAATDATIDGSTAASMDPAPITPQADAANPPPDPKP